jgi:hypothetical protein
MGARTLRGNVAEGLALFYHVIPAQAGTQVRSLDDCPQQSH